jgi:hypothetical protein
VNQLINATSGVVFDGIKEKSKDITHKKGLLHHKQSNPLN